MKFTVAIFNKVSLWNHSSNSKEGRVFLPKDKAHQTVKLFKNKIPPQIDLYTNLDLLYPLLSLPLPLQCLDLGVLPKSIQRIKGKAQ